MISEWTKQEISSILLQLEQRGLPFSQYTFCKENDRCKVLGSGSFALVFDAEDRKGQNRFCIKVMGFGEKRIDPEEFRRLGLRALATYKKLGQQWGRMRAAYRSALPELTSAESWKQVFDQK